MPLVFFRPDSYSKGSRIGIVKLMISRHWTEAGSGLLDFNARKTQLVSFDRSNNTGAIDMKVDGSVLEENSS